MIDVKLPMPVKLQNWYCVQNPGGIVWADPNGLWTWTVAKLHARYLRAVPQPYGRTQDRRAYLVDLNGRGFLPDLSNVLVYQDPRGHWHLREVDDEYLDSIVLHRLDVQVHEPLTETCCRYDRRNRQLRDQPGARDACEQAATDSGGGSSG